MSTVKNPASSLESKILAGALGTVVTLIVQKAISASWKSITGTEPPDPGDPDASTVQAVAWTAASAVGLAVAQVVVTRFATRRFGHLADRLRRH